MRELTWSESHADALQESLRGVNAGLDAFRGRQVPLEQGSDVSFGKVHVVLQMKRFRATVKYFISCYKSIIAVFLTTRNWISSSSFPLLVLLIWMRRLL